MILYIRIGLRNLLKNYSRSAKTILTIVIGLSACLLSQGFMTHTLWGLRESLINGGLGHIQLYRQGFLEDADQGPYRHGIADSEDVIRELAGLPQIELIAPRLNFQGMISSGEKSAVFMGTAGLPEQESLLNALVTLKDGTFLQRKNPFGIVIGSGVARKLAVSVGDSVTLMTALEDGGLNALDVEIIGVVEAQLMTYNDALVYAPLETVQEFVAQPDLVDRIILLLSETDAAELIKPRLNEICNRMGLEYRDWRQLAGKQYTQPKLFFDLIDLLIMTIIILTVIFSIINTLNLTIYERIREIGTIRSLGATRLQVGKIFMMESFLIGVFGGLAGLVVGYGLATFLNALGGIPIPPPPGQARGYIALFKPDFRQALYLGMLFLITATAAGVYPAVRASRLRIADALRWI